MSSGQWGLIGALLGALVVGGAWLVVAGWTGWLVPSSPGSGRSSVLAARRQRAVAQLPEGWRRRLRWLVVAAGVAAVGTWWVTERPVHGMLAGVVVLAWPWLWHPAGPGDVQQIARLEALAEWLQYLAGSRAAGSTLDRAVVESASAAPAPITVPVGRLARRLQQRATTPERAYRRFADDLADAAADHVVKVFLAHAASGGQGLRAMLQTLSQRTTSQARAMRQVDTDRGRIRGAARMVAVTAVCMVSVLVGGTSYGEVYGTGPGQLVLLLAGCAFAGAVVWLRRRAATVPVPRGFLPLDSSVEGVRA